MATLTSTLTLSSSDVSSDTLSLSVTATLTTTEPSIGPSRVSVADAATQVLYADSGAAGAVFMFIKNTNSSGSASLELKTDAGNTFGSLENGEFCFIPVDANEGVEVTAAGAAVVVEYAYFTRG